MTERTMRSVSQLNPADAEHAVGTVFRRGPPIVADGGERGAHATREEGASPGESGDSAEGTDGDEDRRTRAGKTMEDVDQTPPDEDASANRVWERGGEPPAGDSEDDHDADDDIESDE
jgi:hypothetical protein